MRETDDELPNRIRDHREALGLSQGQLAGLVGVTVGAISAFELGQKMPSTTTSLTLARVLGTTVEGLFTPTASTPSVESSPDRPDSATAAANGAGDDRTPTDTPLSQDPPVPGLVGGRIVDEGATE